MDRRYSKNNYGYSLVELIIVMAIIIVLAATATISYTMIHSAKAKDAAIKLNSELNELKTRSMNMTPRENDTDPYSNYALELYTDGDTPHIQLVKFNTNTNVYEDIDDTDINLSSSVRVQFTGVFLGENSSTKWNKTDYVSGHKGATGENDSPVYICFDKRGNCYSGYGEYNFMKSNGTTVAHVKVGMNGSISVR